MEHVRCVFRRMQRWTLLTLLLFENLVGAFNGLQKGEKNKNLTLYVVRIQKKTDGSILLQDSAPCAACVKSLKMCGIKKVIYTVGSSTLSDPKVKIMKVANLSDEYVTNGGKYYNRNNAINIYSKKDYQRLLVSIPN